MNTKIKNEIEHLIKKINMFKKLYKIALFITFFTLMLSLWSKEVINEIDIEGNQRISSESIKMFAGVSISDDLTENNLNEILKKLYDTSFFDLVSVKILNNTLVIKVTENPIIQNITFEGIKSSKIIEDLKKNVLLKSRSSFNEVLLDKDKKLIRNYLKDKGYYFSQIDISKEELGDNKINLFYSISLGEKAKIKKISFVGNKIFKDKKLKGVILSEYNMKLDRKKYLNESPMNFEKIRNLFT